jgi:hypothetical protein
MEKNDVKCREGLALHPKSPAGSWSLLGAEPDGGCLPRANQTVSVTARFHVLVTLIDEVGLPRITP